MLRLLSLVNCRCTAFVLFLLASGILGGAVSAAVRINEVMASNGSTIADEDGDFEDWIELHNHGEYPVDVSGWGLSDNYDDPFRWIFPEVTRLDPAEYLLVWASGKNRTDGELHTNFSISASGEEIIITRPEGIRVDELEPVVIPRDVSVGRIDGGGETWFFFGEPTPGAANATEAFLGVLDPPTFSHPAGFYEAGFSLELHASEGATVLYTKPVAGPALTAAHKAILLPI